MLFQGFKEGNPRDVVICDGNVMQNKKWTSSFLKSWSRIFLKTFKSSFWSTQSLNISLSPQWFSRASILVLSQSSATTCSKKINQKLHIKIQIACIFKSLWSQEKGSTTPFKEEIDHVSQTREGGEMEWVCKKKYGADCLSVFLCEKKWSKNKAKKNRTQMILCYSSENYLIAAFMESSCL